MAPDRLSPPVAAGFSASLATIESAMRMLSHFYRYVQTRRWLFATVCVCGGVLLLINRNGVPTFTTETGIRYRTYAYDRVVASSKWRERQLEAFHGSLYGARLTGAIEHDRANSIRFAAQSDIEQPDSK
ncbi:MAG: hypothetical protein AB7O26_15155 [Planctomycetaceae bacterium]